MFHTDRPYKVNHDALIHIIRNYKLPSYLIDIISEMFINTWYQIWTVKGVSGEFKIDSGVTQACVLSPLLFNCFIDKIIREALEMTPGWRIEYTTAEGLYIPEVQREDISDVGID